MSGSFRNGDDTKHNHRKMEMSGETSRMCVCVCVYIYINTLSCKKTIMTHINEKHWTSIDFFKIGKNDFFCSFEGPTTLLVVCMGPQTKEMMSKCHPYGPK
jgi:hypothetical protein